MKKRRKRDVREHVPLTTENELAVHNRRSF